MMEPASAGGNWRWLLWLIVLAVWTVGLVMPDPLERGPSEEKLSIPYLVSKLAHLGVYSMLAIGASLLPVRSRWWGLGLLVLHAPLGEFLQTLTPTRHGSLLDVAIDLVGISIGCALTWRRWCEKIPPPGQ